MKISIHYRKLTPFFFIMLVTLLHSFCYKDNYYAATSYTNAKEFYNSTSSDLYNHHAEMIDGSIYYATSARLAISSENTRYLTIGFDIELSGNGHSVSFSVQRTNGSMTEIHSCQDSTHEYNLYVIDDKTLYTLARIANSLEANYVLSASVINVKMNAILTLVEGDSVKGGISEDDLGGFTYWGKIYQLANADDLKALKAIFTNHKFKSYYNINEELPNYELSILYNLQGLNTVSANKATVNNGYSIQDDYLFHNNSIYIQKSRALNQMALINPYEIELEKTGYHLKNGLEWITKDYHSFSSSTRYMPKNINSHAGLENIEVTMYANWQPNQYTIYYISNEGTGFVLPTDFYYDELKHLRKNTFSRPGYKLKEGAEWNTKSDGSGTSYSSEEIVCNLTDKNGEDIMLYANWEPEVYTITLDKQNGTGGTTTIYEHYGVGYFTDKACTKSITSISMPSLKGHTCNGYYRNILGKSTHLINANGNILKDSKYFKEDITIYAYFTADTYTITFDKQGGLSDIGTATAIATFNEYFPKADCSIKEGYTFKGYYTETNGKGTQHYNEYMASSGIYPYLNNIKLFAYWVDETRPDITLNANFKSWTNQPILLTAQAYDKGVGLKSLIIYRIAQDGSLSVVASNTTCNGAYTTILSYANTSEGIVRYKAVATDINNHTSESYQTVYYDITPPRGEITKKNLSANSLLFKLNVTDVKVK